VAGDVRDWWQQTELATCSWLLSSPSEPVLGAAWLDRQGTDLGIGIPIASPAHGDVIEVMVGLLERRTAELGLVRLQVAVLAPDDRAERLLQERGYTHVRRFYEMAIQLEGVPETPLTPQGCSLHPVEAGEARAFHATISEAFEDHWEHHYIPFEEWWPLRTGDPDFDISWWFMARYGGEPVAAIRNVPGRNGGVYVASLGVRRGWRGLGVGKALLAHTFRRAWDEGFTRVTLGVDASSPTGATALYHSVGMSNELETTVWERPLRGS
jgi:GNAT superfamily N-acetyltransferase